MASYFICIVLLLFASYNIANCQQQLQFIKLWTGSTCDGNPNWTFSDNGEVANPTPTRTLSYELNGLWKIELEYLNNEERSILFDSDTGGICSFFGLPGELGTIRLTRYGDLYQNSTNIYLFPEKNFHGTPTIVTANGHIYLNRDFNSYFFTGPNDWKIVTENENVVCLKSNLENSYGMTYSLNMNMNIDSITLGCDPRVHQKQYLKLWSSNCTGDSEWSLDDTGEIVFPTPLVITELSYRLSGLWKIQFLYSDDAISNYMKSDIGDYCYFHISQVPISRIRAVRYGDAYQNSTNIHLFTEIGFAGTPVIIDENGADNLNLIIKSFFFTGPYSWKISNSSGFSFNLEHWLKDDMDFGISYIPVSQLEISRVEFNRFISTTTNTEITSTTLSSTSSTSEKSSGQRNLYLSYSIIILVVCLSVLSV